MPAKRDSSDAYIKQNPKAPKLTPGVGIKQPAKKDRWPAAMTMTGTVSTSSWKQQQPPLRRRKRFFCCGGSCRPYFLLIPLIAVFVYALGMLAAVVVAAALLATALLFSCLCGCLVTGFWVYQKMWSCRPWGWDVDLYTKLGFLAYQSVLFSQDRPLTGPEVMRIDLLKPKAKLRKSQLNYALNIQVPKSFEEEFLTARAGRASRMLQWIKENAARLPMTDRFGTFDEDEDPVAYVMAQLGSVYPYIYQDWRDKQTDFALTRFVLYGLGAHRIETVVEDGERYYVVRTNALSPIPVRKGFARYGGDAYFDTSWRPVKIVDAGLGVEEDDGLGDLAVSHPGDSTWPEAKFRFRSSLSVLVTLVDHLYGIHLEMSNILVTAVREQLSPEHPVRRFLTPFLFRTISVNDNARHNLVQPRSMGPRCFAFSDAGLSMAFAAAPSLFRGGMEVPEAEGGPLLDRRRYIAYLREKHGIDTEYCRQSERLWSVLHQFVVDYVAYYYPDPEDIMQDGELLAMIRQYVHRLTLVSPKARVKREPYNAIVLLLTNHMYMSTGGHEQVGAIEAYVQDASFCAFKWVPGKLVGTRQTATAQALLMSFTSLPMPALMGANWTHLFPSPCGDPRPEAKTPAQAFSDFQTALALLSREAEAYNAAASTRPFPECFPLYVMNPKYMSTSVSV